MRPASAGTFVAVARRGAACKGPLGLVGFTIAHAMPAASPAPKSPQPRPSVEAGRPRLARASMINALPMERPDIIRSGKGQLGFFERLQVGLVRRSFEPGALSSGLRWGQEHLGRHWIHLATRNLHTLHHTERIPKFNRTDSFVLVANHRSFFDMYVITAELLGLGVQQRMLFPVRSNFFYDNPMGLFVNGVMSFFAMYPPIFRDRKRAHLNRLAMDELVWLLRQGGHFCGFHPEGTRNKGNPYELLDVRPGVGKLIHQARVPVLPVFTNGLLSQGLKRQVRSNFDGSGTPIHTVFGSPIEFDGLLERPGTPALYRQIAETIRTQIMQLGREERTLRRAADSGHTTPETGDE